MSIARYLPRFRSAYRSFGELEDRENWSRAQIESFQLERLNQVWHHAIQFVPYYRNLRSELGLPGEFESLAHFAADVPTLSKTVVRQRTLELLSERPQPGKWHTTSGSTGSPLKAYRAHEAHHEMLRASYRYYRMWGHDIFDRMVFLWNMRTTKSNGLLGSIKGIGEFMEDRLRNRLRLSALTLGKDDLRRYLKQIADFQPSALYSYSQAAYLLAQEALEQGFHCSSLKVINLTSEPASDHMVRTIEKAFQVPCIIQYGCVEFGFVAGEWPDRTLRVRDDVAFVETPPRGDGTFGMLLTSLNNSSFPLLRYDINDLTDRAVETPERGFRLLGRISGRCGDFLYTPSGRCLHSTVVDNIFEEEYFRYVRRYQVRQRDDGSLLTLVELNDPEVIPDIKKLAQHLALEVEGCSVEVRIVPRIEQTAAGKHRTVISSMEPRGLGSSANRSSDAKVDCSIDRASSPME